MAGTRRPGVTNLASLLFEHPFADNDALLHTVDRTVTAGAARSNARDIADSLRAAGVEPGHAVAVRLANGPELVAAMFGVWEAGAVLVAVNPRLPAAEVEAMLAATRPAAVLDSDGVHPRADPVTFDDGVAIVLWTSGTTGAPKPVLHTHVAYFELLDRVIGALRPADRVNGAAPPPNLIPVSMSLNAGLYNTLFGLRAGSALVIMAEFVPAAFADLVHRFSIRSTVLPPAAIAMLNDSDVTEVADLAPLRFVRSITAPLSPLQARRFADRFGAFVLNGYGQTETGEVIGWTARDAREHPDKLGAAGRPHPGVEVRIGTEGHLLVRPPQAALGVEDRTDADGFIDTGDLARIDDDGFVWIEGRVSDVINRGGHKVFPDSVEEVLKLCPGVADAAVVGIADERLGEVPVAFLVGNQVGDDVLIGLCREHLAPYKVPTEFRWVDSLPRNEAGKLLRRALVVPTARTPYRLESVPCPVCAWREPEPVGVGEDFEYRTGPDTFLAMRCGGCGVVYLDPRPVRDELARMYPPTYHAFEFAEEQFGFVYRVRSRLETARLRRWCRGLPPRARVLDVGCGDGFHLDLLQRGVLPDATVEGIDADERAVAAAHRRGLDVRQGFVERADLPAASYDCVLLIQTIEHVHEPVVVLQAIARLLRPGGRIVVVTDNTGSLDFRWFRGRWWGGYHFPRHLQLFDARSMRALADTAGLDVAVLTTMTSPVNWVYSVRNLLDDLGAPRGVVEQFSLRTPATLALGTAWDSLHRLAGRGALLRAELRRPV